MKSPKLVAPPLLVLTAAVALAVTAASAALRVSRQYPLTPWESAIIADAWRITRGLPVYTEPKVDHATHMYGPLTTLLDAALFALTGPSLLAVRTPALMATLGAAALVTFALSRSETVGWRFVIFSLTAAQFFRARAAYAEARPDALAVCLSAVSLLLLFRAFKRQSWRSWCGGAAIMLAAFFFKQTSAAVALVPLVVVCIPAAKRHSRRDWTMATMLPLLMLAAGQSLRWLAPTVSFYMIEVPAGFGFELKKLGFAILSLVFLNAFAMVTLAAWLWSRRHNCDRSEAEGLAVQWLFATWIVAAIAGVAAYTKRGGGENSFLPVFLASTALAAYLLPRTMQRDFAGRTRAWLTIALSAALLVDLATVPRIVSWAGGRARHGDRNHARVVARIEQLQGTVLCPDDPTITLFAGRDPGRSLDCELDAVAQRFVPTYLEADIRNADWLVRVHATWDAHLTGVDMHGWGYRRVTDPAFDGTVYSLWRRERD